MPAEGQPARPARAALAAAAALAGEPRDVVVSLEAYARYAEHAR